MKKLIGIISIILFVCGAVNAGWMPKFIRDSADYQGDQTTINVNSGTIRNLTALTFDTGQGANELYDMDQNVQTTDTVTFDKVTSSSYTHTDPLWLYGNYVRIGNAGTTTYVDGDGDLYVEGELEVLDNSYFAADILIKNQSDHFRLYDTDSADAADYYNINYNNDNLQITFTDDSTSITTYTLTLEQSGIVAVTNIHSQTFDYADGEGDLYVLDELEVDNGAYITGDVLVLSGDYLINNYGNGIGVANNEKIIFKNGSLAIEDNGTDMFTTSVTSSTFYQKTYIPLPSDTEANLKLVSPQFAYIQYSDTTNNQLVISTGTGVGAFGQLTDFTTLPVGW